MILEATPPVLMGNVTWYFTSISGCIFLPCNNHSGRYNFSSDCLILTISNVTASDGGLYEVFASTRAGNGSGRMVLTVTEVPPQFVNILKNHTLQMSENHKLVCGATGDPKLTFTWKLNMEPIIEDHLKYILVTNSTMSVLMIREVTHDDEGTYTCSVSNRFGQRSITGHVVVQGPPIFKLVPPATRDVVSGEMMRMTCSASGEPAPQITWYHRGVPLTEEMSNGTVIVDSRITAKTTTSKLMILNATKVYVGIYACKATNFLGISTREFLVSLVERPIISSIAVVQAKNVSVNDNKSMTSVSHGDSLVLEEFSPVDMMCSASGHSSLVMMWFKNGIRLTNSSLRTIESTSEHTSEGSDTVSTATLTINRIKLSDSGLYSCQAVSGNVSPILGVNVWSIHINVSSFNECNAITLPCVNDGLCIDAVGHYVCKCFIEDIEVYYGKTCQRVSTVAEAPHITKSPQSRYVEISSTVHLQCKARGIPNPVVTWFRDHTAIEGPQSVGEVYTIAEMTPEHRGVYHCQAENDEGTVESSGATIVIYGLAQVRVGLQHNDDSTRVKRQSISLNDLIEQLEMLAVGKVLTTDNGMNLTIYSVKPATDDSGEVIVTILADNKTASAVSIAIRSYSPLRNFFKTFSDLFPNVTFDIQQSERFDGCPIVLDHQCSNAAAIEWPQTEIGGVAHVKCPCEVDDELINKLQASRVCGGTYSNGAAWEEPRCDVCKFSEARKELCKLGLVENPFQLSRDLANVVHNSKSEFLKEDVSLAVTLLEKVKASPEALQRQEVQEDTLFVVSEINKIPLDIVRASQVLSGSSSKLLNIVDVTAESVNVSQKNYIYTSASFGLLVEVTGYDGDSRTPNIDLLHERLTVERGLNKTPSAFVQAQLPLSVFTNQGNKTRISIAIFPHSALFQPREQYIKQMKTTFTLVGSSIISITIIGQNISGLKDSNRVSLIFEKNQNTSQTASCQFWNVSLDDSFGAWDRRGCELVSSNETTATCKCNHLTHFALLMDVAPHLNTRSLTINDKILTWVSYIGASVCIVCLILTVLTNLGIRKLRCTLYNKLLVQLCLALTGLYITFILGTFSSSVPVLCGIISALAHYFFLATFFWMASIAIHIYRSIVQPFKLPFENHFEISGAICWVSPVFVVGFSIAPHYQNYIHKDFCRAYGYSFWIGALVPFGILYIFNWIVYVIVIVSLVRRPNIRKEGKLKNKQLKENFTVSAMLSVLFGLGWGCGLLASTDVKVDYVRIPFEWVFTILSCAQGVIIFYIYCLRQPEIQKKVNLVSFLHKKQKTEYVQGLCHTSGTGSFDMKAKKQCTTPSGAASKHRNYSSSTYCEVNIPTENHACDSSSDQVSSNSEYQQQGSPHCRLANSELQTSLTSTSTSINTVIEQISDNEPQATTFSTFF